jgi:hypothetical protein
MSLIEYAKKQNMNIVTMNNLVKNFKKNNDDMDLIQVIEFMAERINILSNNSLENTGVKETQKAESKKKNVVDQDSFKVISFKVTTTKLYLIINRDEALEYEFDKDNISKCYEFINSNRIDKAFIGTVFKKVLFNK